MILKLRRPNDPRFPSGWKETEDINIEGVELVAQVDYDEPQPPHYGYMRWDEEWREDERICTPDS